ncbi:MULTISPECIES: NAD(P)H-binding protein [Streptomyces]|uniref:NAD(P)H-binding protein n=1 Tax=Streptomyces TaxID=1883 RepID=UPI00068BA061|nr:NAD(P)H-binding protein [Streptomyces sp. NRRL S-623]
MTQTADATPAPFPVLVTGSTGKTGRRVVARLRELGVETRAASRSGETRFDWEDPATWVPALEGAAAVYIVPLDTAPSPTPAFVEQAVAAGVRRLVLLSARGVNVPGYFGPGVYEDGGPHLHGEEAVRSSGLAWTILRPGWFAQNFSEGVFLDGVRAGELTLPVGDGEAAYIDTDDIAAVAVAALTEDGHDSEEYELSGPRALGVADVLDEIAKVTGVRASYAPAEEAVYREGLVAYGMSEVEASLWMAALEPIRTSREAPLKDGVHRALGRPPRDIADVFRDAAAEGAWG